MRAYAHVLADFMPCNRESTADTVIRIERSRSPFEEGVSITARAIAGPIRELDAQPRLGLR
jgi:hypothetical protein